MDVAANEWLFKRIEDAMEEHKDRLNKLYDQVISMQQGSIPKYLTQEYMFNPSSQSITVNRQTNNIILVRSVIFQFTSQPATLTLGDKVWTFTSVPTTPVVWNEIQLILRPSDPRVITQNAAGQLSLLIMGEDLGDSGVY